MTVSLFNVKAGEVVEQVVSDGDVACSQEINRFNAQEGQFVCLFVCFLTWKGSEKC